MDKSSDGLQLDDLTDIGEIYRPNSVVQNIATILDKHLKALEVSGRNADLLFNTATVYVEMLDDMIGVSSNLDQALRSYYNSGQQILMELLPQQVNALESFVRELSNSYTESSDTTPKSTSRNMEHEQEEFESVEVTQPVDIFDTVLLGYKLIQAAYENISKGELDLMNMNIHPFLDTLDQISTELVSKYCENSESRNEMLQNITSSQVNELKIAKQSILSLQYGNVSLALESWAGFFTNEVPDEIPEKYLTCVDNIQTVLEWDDITLDTLNNNSSPQDKDWYWEILSQQNKLLKKAQELTQNQLNAKKRSPLGVELGIGATITQLCNIMIDRADLNLQMALIKDYEPSVKNQAALVQNCKTLLKSSMNIANTSGGLRERAIEKLDREKKLSEAVFRLCLLEGKTSLEKLDEIMTRQRWEREVAPLKKVDAYKELLQQIPHVPRRC